MADDNRDGNIEERLWPGGRVFFLAPFTSIATDYQVVIENSDSERGDDPNFAFCLAEYEKAFGLVLQDAIEALARSKSPVLRSISEERAEVVRTTHVTAPSGEIVTNPPLRVAMPYGFTTYDITEFDLTAFAQSCDQAAEILTDARLDALLDFSGRISEAFGNAVNARGGRFGWPVLLQALERLPIDFSSTGEPLLPQIV